MSPGIHFKAWVHPPRWEDSRSFATRNQKGKTT